MSVSSSLARLEKPLVTDFNDHIISAFVESKLVTNVSSVPWFDDMAHSTTIVLLTWLFLAGTVQTFYWFWIEKITHMWGRWGTPQNFFSAFIDELEKQIIIKKTVEVGQ